jgi:hypothetical protein
LHRSSVVFVVVVLTKFLHDPLEMYFFILLSIPILLEFEILDLVLNRLFAENCELFKKSGGELLKI